MAEGSLDGTTVRVALRHSGRRSRRPSIDVDGADLVLRLPGVLGSRGWAVPCDQVGVVNLRNVEGVDPSDPKLVLVNPLQVPYLETSVDLRGPNVALVFRRPQRVPELPRIGGSGALSARKSRSRRGVWLDGVCLRAEDPVQAVITLVGAGAERVLNPADWLRQHRATTSNEEFLELARDFERRRRPLGTVALLAVAVLLGMRWASGRSDAWWPLPVAAGCVLVLLGIPIWMKLTERRLARRAKALADQRDS